ncbi:RNA deprotection pyrophosphohydrolase [Texcoconibacillus texcoconensis]|uniref:8-oxo-dGTP diphosphatase n=1 Tax=Texcoconibacillus texcoconensis TaxID=1095777 RepID=A0A840QN93_9BACI|nr:nucleoside triphosphatase YtkD [Texcoconibacillus texcoconensis]MBB5172827.1 8-oxo-dGTP diphosphatase [Texcoconibacillus texcoconensis]
MKDLYTFKDYYGNLVRLSFDDHPFSSHPKHVWVICRFKNNWLLTEHLSRGLEFPGGKVEEGEKPIEAAEREVFEETGGIVEQLVYIGQYQVYGKSECVVKNIYFANIGELIDKNHYYETKGPRLLQGIPKDVKNNRAFSFIMKDDVLNKSIERLTDEVQFEL